MLRSPAKISDALFLRYGDKIKVIRERSEICFFAEDGDF